MKKIRLKSWDICMQQMKCFVWQNRIYRRIKRLGGKELSLSSSERYICRVKFVTVF